MQIRIENILFSLCCKICPRKRWPVGIMAFGLLLNSSLNATTIKVTIENLAPEAGTHLTPVWIGFHDGSFDLFDEGETVQEALEWLAEDGDTSSVSADFGMSAGGVRDATITGPGSPPVFFPGNSNSTVFTLDAGSPLSRYLSFASMIIPSNDAFVANDDPLVFEIFDEEGNFIETEILIMGSLVWDAGSEVNDEVPANVAFLEQAAPNTGESEDGNVQFHEGFSEEGAILGAFPNADFTMEDYEIVRITITEEPALVFVEFGSDDPNTTINLSGIAWQRNAYNNKLIPDDATDDEGNGSAAAMAADARVQLVHIRVRGNGTGLAVVDSHEDVAGEMLDLGGGIQYVLAYHRRGEAPARFATNLSADDVRSIEDRSGGEEPKTAEGKGDDDDKGGDKGDDDDDDGVGSRLICVGNVRDVQTTVPAAAANYTVAYDRFLTPGCAAYVDNRYFGKDVPWISYSSAVNDGRLITYTVEANTTTSVRTGNIWIIDIVNNNTPTGRTAITQRERNSQPTVSLACDPAAA